LTDGNQIKIDRLEIKYKDESIPGKEIAEEIIDNLFQVGNTIKIGVPTRIKEKEMVVQQD